tara:strand:+ start:6846 stop:8213 length:1368 start_codon:yes stop_codon:yes gene_type:complete
MIINIIILSFFFLVLFIGYFTTSSKNVSEYIFTGRKLTVPALVATIVTTWYGGINEIGIETINNGIVVWLYFGFFYYLAALIYAFVVAPKIIRKKYDSIPLAIYKTYGKLPALISLFFFLLYLIPASYLLILGQLISEIFNLNLNLSLFIGLIVSSIYTLKGGFKSIVNTDKIQFVVMFTGFIILTFTLNFSDNYGFILLKNLYETDQILFSIPGKVEWSYVFMFLFLSLLTFIDPSFYQRVNSARDLKTVQKSILISIFFWICFDFMTISSALYYYALSLENSLNPLVTNSPYVELSKIVFSNNNFLLGIFFISILSVVMSTIDSYTFLSSTTLRYDLSKILGKEIQIKSLRNSIILIMFCSYLLSTSFDRALDYWYYFGTYVFVSSFFPLICALFSIKIYHVALMMILSLLATFSYEIISLYYNYNLPSIYIGFIVSSFFLLIQKFYIIKCKN